MTADRALRRKRLAIRVFAAAVMFAVTYFLGLLLLAGIRGTR